MIQSTSENVTFCILHRRNMHFRGETLVSGRKGPCFRQGTESSDFSLISDFFPTSRAIFEISVNLKRIFLMEVGVWVMG